MRRLRSLSEAECYARCYGGGMEATVHVLRLAPLRASAVAVDGEALRRRFEHYLDARDPEQLAEPEAA